MLLITTLCAAVFLSCASKRKKIETVKIEKIEKKIQVPHRKVMEFEKDLSSFENNKKGEYIFNKKCLTICHKAMQSGKKVKIKPEIYSPAGWFYFLEYDSKHQNILNDTEKDLILKFLGSESVPSGF